MIENKEMAEVIRRITGFFAGEDGGSGFITFACYLNEFQRRADDGCRESNQILETVYRFDRLLQVVLKAV